MPRNQILIQPKIVIFTSHEKAAADIIRVKPKHQKDIPWESNIIESQRANLKVKADIRNKQKDIPWESNRIESQSANPKKSRHKKL